MLGLTNIWFWGFVISAGVGALIGWFMWNIRSKEKSIKAKVILTTSAGCVISLIICGLVFDTNLIVYLSCLVLTNIISIFACLYHKNEELEDADERGILD